MYWKKTFDLNGNVTGREKTTDYTSVNTDSQYDYLGSSIPKVYGALTNTFKYRDFDFSFMLYYSLGGHLADHMYKESLILRQGFSISSDFIKNRWKQPGDETKSNVKGQALAMRAYCYFQLVQFYQQTYAIAKEKAGVPLRLSSSDAADLPRSTVSACYEQIVNDLITAKSLLGNFDRGEVKYYLNKDVVNGILARVYLVMNEWEKAKAVASEAFSNYSTLMTRDEWRSGFCHASYSEIMWGYYQTTESNMGDNGMFSFWYDWPESTGEPFYNFNNYFANSEYEALFEKTDDRYLFWHRKDAYTDKWAYSKFYDPGDGNAKSRGDYVLMRGSEMLLIMAECDAQLGNTTEALSYLNQLQKARNVKDLTTATAKNDLLESIYVERRKELLGEGGGGMLDYLRLQKPLVRTGDHFAAGMSSEVFPLASNDYRFIFQIPQREIQLNNSISESDQNPFSGQ